jgi:hypothetical protein
MFSGTGHRGFHRGFSGVFDGVFSAGLLAVFIAVFPGLAPFVRIVEKPPTAFFYGYGKTPPGFLSGFRQNPSSPFLSEIPENPRLFWVSSDETPRPRRSPLGLNKSQHGAAATLPFVGAANHPGAAANVSIC